MNSQKLQKLLGWSVVLNAIFLILVALVILLAHDWIYKIHSTFFMLSLETYDALLYGFLAFWKALLFVFVLVPYIAIRIVNKEA